MSAYERRRGATFEREVANILQSELGFSVRRTLGQARDGGTDLHLPGGWALECKRRKSIPDYLSAGMKQAATGGQYPAVVVRPDGGEPLVLLRMADFIRLVREELVSDDGK